MRRVDEQRKLREANHMMAANPRVVQSVSGISKRESDTYKTSVALAGMCPTKPLISIQSAVVSLSLLEEVAVVADTRVAQDFERLQRYRHA
mgnify:CR=1 FL=1